MNIHTSNKHKFQAFNKSHTRERERHGEREGEGGDINQRIDEKEQAQLPWKHDAIT